MHTTLSCPHCGDRGMSPLRKIFKGPNSPTACESCGEGIAVPSSISGAYVPSWALIWLSGYVEGLATKGALWLGAVAVLILACLFFAPLEPRPLDARRARRPAWFNVWFFCSSAAAIGAFGINFFPSRDYATVSCAVSVVASVPILRVLMIGVPDAEQQSLRFLLIFAFFVAVNYLAIAVVLPAGPVALLGEMRVSQTKVQYKSRSNKLIGCSRSLELGEDNSFLKRKLCVPNEVWEGVGRGDSILISERHSWFGDFVEGTANTRPEGGI